MHTVQTLTHNGRCVHSIPDASDDSPNDHLRDAVRCRLQHRPYRQDETSQPDTVLATELLASEQAEQRSCEATDLVDGHYETLERVTAVAGCCVDLRELVRESRAGKKTAHDALI